MPDHLASSGNNFSRKYKMFSPFRQIYPLSHHGRWVNVIFPKEKKHRFSPQYINFQSSFCVSYLWVKIIFIFNNTDKIVEFLSLTLAMCCIKKQYTCLNAQAVNKSFVNRLRIQGSTTGWQVVFTFQDILISTPMSTDCVSPLSVNKMQQISAEFFNHIEIFSKLDDRRDLDGTNAVLDKATERNHLR